MAALAIYSLFLALVVAFDATKAQTCLYCFFGSEPCLFNGTQYLAPGHSNNGNLTLVFCCPATSDAPCVASVFAESYATGGDGYSYNLVTVQNVTYEPTYCDFSKQNEICFVPFWGPPLVLSDQYRIPPGQCWQGMIMCLNLSLRCLLHYEVTPYPKPQPTQCYTRE